MSSFGRIFKISTFGESHCAGVGVVVDGVPPRMSLSAADIQVQLDRRRPGGNKLGTERDEADQVQILSGIENADYTYQMKYGIHASSGGGRSSARETIGRVAAGAIAEKYLLEEYGIEIVAWVSSVGDHDSSNVDMETITRAEVDSNEIRCPDSQAAEKMTAEIVAAREAKDSVGGVVSCVCRNLPVGLGEPVFDRLEAKLAHAMLSLPATKGFEIGSGFSGARMRGSDHNDPFIQKGDRLGTTTNHSGGVQGGISNGEAVYFRVAFKPPATIGQEQQTADYSGVETTLEAKGRHDPCVVPRAVPIVESMVALVLADLVMIQKYNFEPLRHGDTERTQVQNIFLVRK